MWSETIHIKSNFQDILFKYAHFLKPGILFRSSECLKLLRRNHYKNIWRVEFVEKVMHIIQLSHVLQGEVVQVFFYSNTYTDCLIAEFPVLEHLCSVYLYPIIVGWLSILFLYGYNALFQWVICKCSKS